MADKKPTQKQIDYIASLKANYTHRPEGWARTIAEVMPVDRKFAPFMEYKSIADTGAVRFDFDAAAAAIQEWVEGYADPETMTEASDLINTLKSDVAQREFWLDSGISISKFAIQN